MTDSPKPKRARKPRTTPPPAEDPIELELPKDAQCPPISLEWLAYLNKKCPPLSMTEILSTDDLVRIRERAAVRRVYEVFEYLYLKQRKGN